MQKNWGKESWIGLGGMTVTTFLISNHCSTVDAVYFTNYDFYESLTIPVLPRLKVSIRMVSGTCFTSLI